MMVCKHTQESKTECAITSDALPGGRQYTVELILETVSSPHVIAGNNSVCARNGKLRNHLEVMPTLGRIDLGGCTVYPSRGM